MSVEVVENVVKMVFQGQQFEQNANAALQTLDKLKTALNFEGAVKGIENLGGSVKNAGMDQLYNGVYKVQEGFSALDIVATRVLQNITDKVQNVATDLAKKITIEPLKQGLQEYETQINSVQTILSNTSDKLKEQGLDTEHDRIEKVNGVLDELNKYADMTIYNFTEMTRNIGTFTAAGVELDTAATSIKGIANLAAMSGSNSQQASTAMYQLSQAIAAGSVKLQDWNSVVNAGMGGKLFQNELIDTAKAMGVADEQFQQLTQGAITFRESLSSGWITSEVLTNTLEKFTAGSEGYTKSQVEQMQKLWKARGYSEQQIKELTGSVHQLTEEEEANLRTKWAEKGFSEEQIDHILEMGSAATSAATKVKTFTQLLDTVGEALQSGWTQSWEYIIGDFEQAKMLWTEISDILNLYIGKSADSRNKILEEWSKAAYTYNEAGELVRVADGKIVEGGQMVREEMGGRELIIQGIRNAFQGALEIGLQFGKAWDTNFWGKNNKQLDDISLTGKKLIELSRAFYDFTDNFKKSLTGDDGPTELLKHLRQNFDWFAEIMRSRFESIQKIFSGITTVFNAFFHSSFFDMNSLGSIIKFFGGLQGAIESFEWAKFSFIIEGIEALGKVIGYIIGPSKTIGVMLGDLGDNISKVTHAFDKMVNNEDVSKFEAFFDKLVKDLEPFIDSIKNILNITTNGQVTGFQAFFNQLVAIMEGKFGGLDPFNMFAKVLESIVNILKALVSVATPILQAFVNVFGPSLMGIISYLSQFIDRIHNLTSSLVLNETTMRSVYTLFKGLFEVIRSVAFLILDNLLKAWDGLSKVFSDILPNGQNLNSMLTEAGKKLSEFAEYINTLGDGDGVPLFVEIIGKAVEKVKMFFEAFKDFNVLKAFADLINKIGDGIKKALGGTDDMSLLDIVGEKLKQFFQNIKEILSNDNGDIDPAKLFIGGGLGVLIAKIVEFAKDFGDKSTMFKKIADTLNEFADTVGGAIENIGNHFKTQSIKVIATSLLEIAAALFILSIIDAGSLAKSMAALAAVFKEIEVLIGVINTANKGDLAAGAGTIAALGLALMQVSIAVTILSMLKPEKLAQGLIGVSVILWELVAAGYAFSKMDNDLAKGAGSLILLAIALNLLVIPIIALGNINVEAYNQGIGAVTLLLVELVAAAILLGKFGKDFKPSNAIGLILMAESVKILADACLKVKDIPWPDLGKGLAVMAVGLLAMVGAAAIIAKAKLGDDILLLGESLVLLGVAMELLVNSAMGLHGVEWEDLGKMAAVLGVSLLMLWAASKRIDGKNLLMIGGAIFLVATAITELSVSLNLAKVIAPICTALGSAIGGIADAAHAFAMDKSMELFINFLKNLITFLPQLAVALAQSLVQLIAALGNSVGEIIGAVVNIGKAIFAALTQLLPEAFNTLGVFFTELWAFLKEQIPGLFSVLGEFFTQLWAFLTEQTPAFFGWIGTVFEQFFLLLQEKGPMVIELIRIIIDTVLQAIITEAPVIGQTLIVLLQTLLGLLVEFVPQMADAALQILLGFLQAVANNIGQITQAAADIAIAFMDGLAVKMPELVDSAFKLLISWIDGLATAIDENHDKLWDAVGHLIKSIVDAIIDGIKKVVDAGRDMVSQFTDGLTPQDVIDGIFNAGKNLVQGFVDGLLDWTGLRDVANAAADLGSRAWSALTGFLDENSPSKLTFGGGLNFVLGFANGISDNVSEAVNATTSMAYGAVNAFNSVLDSDISTVTPRIAPVIDTSTIGSGINGYIGDVDNTITGTATISGTIEANNQLKTQMAEMMAAGSDYSSIISSVNGLRSDLSTYSDQMSKLQVVMDTGTLVGQIAPGVDKNIGRASILNGRGV